MRSILATFLALGAASAALGQTRTVDYVIQKSPSPGVTYNVYQKTGDCSAATPYVKVNPTPIPATEPIKFTKTLVPYGLYCGFATAVANGAESAGTNPPTLITVAPDPPAGLTTLVANGQIAVDTQKQADGTEKIIAVRFNLK